MFGTPASPAPAIAPLRGCGYHPAGGGEGPALPGGPQPATGPGERPTQIRPRISLRRTMNREALFPIIEPTCG